jgi:hypothetical protein
LTKYEIPSRSPAALAYSLPRKARMRRTGFAFD